MVRAWFGGSVSVGLALGVLACDGGSSRATAPTDPCLVSDCSDGAVRPADASVDAGRATRDASFADDATSGAVFGFDGSRPPYDGGTGVPIRDAAWEDGGVVGPGGPVLPPDPPNRAICSNAGPLGFSTAGLAASVGGRGSGQPDAGPIPSPFGSAWATAAARTGTPGPALIVLDSLGLLASGGTRPVRFGAPRSDAAGGPFGFLQVAQNPIATTWSVLNTYVVNADTGPAAVGPARLRFKTAAGGSVDVPLAGFVLDARFVIAQATEACTALNVNALDVYVPTSAGATVFEGQTLSSWLGAANHELTGPTGVWRITLRGTAPVVSLAGSP